MKSDYLQAAQAYRSGVLSFTCDFEGRLINSGNVGRFYSYANKKFSSRSGIGPIQDRGGRFSIDPRDQSELFNHYFSSVFTNDNNLLPEFNRRCDVDVSMENIVFDPNLVFKRLKRLNKNSSPGPDGLSSNLLTNLSPALSYPLALIYEKFFIHHYVPPVWKLAYIRPILKSGDSSLVSNYRPISLTCILSKVMESVIKDQMMDFLLSNNLISKHQHGFLSGKSTCTQLLESLQDWIVALRAKSCVDVVYIDFSKAFDSVVHSKLCLKLAAYGFGFELFDWIKEFLSGRSQLVLIDCFKVFPFPFPFPGAKRSTSGHGHRPPPLFALYQ